MIALTPVPTFDALRRMSHDERRAAFTRWAKAQPPEATYDVRDVCGCALYQFAKAISPKAALAMTTAIVIDNLTVDILPNQFPPIIWERQDSNHSTFGSLVARLETL